MKKLATLLTIGMLLVGVSGLNAATIQVVPVVGPSGYGTSWAPFRDNVLAALRGNPVTNTGGPSDYVPLSPLQLEPSDMLMTYSSQHSWNGDLSPTGAFADEYGNKPYFSASFVAGKDEQVRLSDVRVSISSTDAAPAFWNATYSFAAYTYNASLIGVRKGNDGQLGTSDDIVVNSGSGTQYMDAIYITGLSPFFTLSNLATAEEEAVFDLTVKYGLGSLDEEADTGMATVEIVPEPATITLLAMPLAVLFRRRR